MANATPNEKTHAGNVQVPFDRKKVMSGKPRPLHCKKIFLIAVSIVMPAMYACAALAKESLYKADTNDLTILDLVTNTNKVLSTEVITNLPLPLFNKRYDLVDRRCEDLRTSIEYLWEVIRSCDSILERLGRIREGGIDEINQIYYASDLLDALRVELLRDKYHLIDKHQIGELQRIGIRFKVALKKRLDKIELECPYPKVSKVESDNLARECEAEVKKLQGQMKKLLRRDPEIVKIQGRIKGIRAKYEEKISKAKKRAMDEFLLKLERRKNAISEFRDGFCKLVRLAVRKPIEEKLELQRRLRNTFLTEREFLDAISSGRREIEKRKQVRIEAMKKVEDRVKGIVGQQQAFEELKKTYFELLQKNGMEEVSFVIYKEHTLIFCYKKGEEVVSLSYDIKNSELDFRGSISKELAAKLIAMRLQINEFQKSLGGKATHD